MNSSVPSSCVSMERMVSIHEAGIAIVDVRLRAATPESFRGFGHIVASFAEAEVDIATWPAPGRRPVEPGTGVGGGVTCGKFEVYRNGDMMHARNHAVDGHYITGWFANPLTASEQSMDVDDSRVAIKRDKKFAE